MKAPIAQHPAVRHLLLRQQCLTEAQRVIAYRAALAWTKPPTTPTRRYAPRPPGRGRAADAGGQGLAHRPGLCRRQRRAASAGAATAMWPTTASSRPCAMRASPWSTKAPTRSRPSTCCNARCWPMGARRWGCCCRNCAPKPACAKPDAPLADLGAALRQQCDAAQAATAALAGRRRGRPAVAAARSRRLSAGLVAHPAGLGLCGQRAGSGPRGTSRSRLGPCQDGAHALRGAVGAAAGRRCTGSGR
jgi:hypothetical protein